MGDTRHGLLFLAPFSFPPASETPMNHRLACAVALALSLSAPTFAADKPAKPTAVNSATANPFFAASTLTFQYPMFDKIKDSDYTPAFEKGMAEQKAEVEAIAN